MKFAHYISVLERDAPEQWRGKFLGYKLLKKQLKRCRSDDGTLDPALENAFFSDLQDQLASINRNFQEESQRTVVSFHRVMKGLDLGCFFLPFWWFGPRHYAALADRAYWCRKYARANAVALRKILKKHDKLCGNERGRTFLQQCWCSTSAHGVGLFLHSPLLDELKAVQDVLQHKMQEIADKDEVVHPHDDITKGESGNHPSNHNKGPVVLLEELIAQQNAAAAAAAAVGGGNTSASHAHNIDAGDDALAHLQRNSTSAASQSSDGLRGAPHNAAPSSANGSLNSLTSPSLRAQRAAALAAIVESPNNLLDSSDIDWEEEPRSSLGGSGAGARRSTKKNQQTGGSDGGGAGPSQQQQTSHVGLAATMTEDGGDDHHPNEYDPDAPTPRQDNSQTTQQNSPAKTPVSSNVVGGGGSGGTSSSSPLTTNGNADVSQANVGNNNNNNNNNNNPGSEVGGGGSSGIGHVLGPFRDDELRCPVCLEVMYKPVGLGCGHKFCKPCALEAAGFGRVIGSFQNIASYIPPRSPCPTCRQTHVYRAAVSLKEVGALIKSRYPEQWAERKAEEKRKLSQRPAVQPPHRTSLRGATPFELFASSSTDFSSAAGGASSTQ